KTGAKNITVNIDQPLLSYVKIYQSNRPGQYKEILNSGIRFPFKTRADKSTIFSAEFEVPDSTICYVQVKSDAPLTLPIVAGRKRVIQDYLSDKNYLFYCYMGIMTCMFLYNVFLMFSIKDDR